MGTHITHLGTGWGRRYVTNMGMGMCVTSLGMGTHIIHLGLRTELETLVTHQG